MRVWNGAEGEFGVKDDSLILAKVPDYRMVYFTKVEETKRKDLAIEWGKISVPCILKSKEHELVLFICVHSMTLVGA